MKHKRHNSTRVLARFMAAVFIAGIMSVFINVQPVRAAASTMSLESPVANGKIGQPVAVTIKINTGGDQVNAVEADFDYPSDKLCFNSIDYSTSDFEVEASEDVFDGFISLVRGTMTPVTGEATVAVVNFTVCGGGAIQLTLDEDLSAVVESVGSTNTLATFNNLQLATHGLSPVYRLVNIYSQARLSTTSLTEANNAVANYRGWKIEGISYYVATSGGGELKPVYRLVNVKTEARLSTTSAAEKNAAVATNTGWKVEGISYYVMNHGGGGLVPVYRMVNVKTEARLSTISVAEKNAAIATNTGWKVEGVSYYTVP